MPAPTVPWELCLNPAPRYYTTDKGVEASASFIINWADAETFYDEVLGTRTGTVTNGVATTLPWAFPPAPRIYCQSCDISPITIAGSPGPGANSGLGAGEFFDKAKANLVFGVHKLGDTVNPDEDDPDGQMQFDPANPITYCYQDMDWSCYSEQLEHGSYVWEGEPNITGFRLTKKTSVATLILRFPLVPFLPAGRIREYMDCVNTHTALGCLPGTLLFEGAATSLQLTSVGRRAKSVTLKFKYRKRPWNVAIRANGSEGTPINASTGAKLYEQKDLRLLFW